MHPQITSAEPWGSHNEGQCLGSARFSSLVTSAPLTALKSGGAL
jgi:hypothetical protein